MVVVMMRGCWGATAQFLFKNVSDEAFSTDSAMNSIKVSRKIEKTCQTRCEFCEKEQIGSKLDANFTKALPLPVLKEIVLQEPKQRQKNRKIPKY